jgi:tetratricopeptide (TPR) repeat protein
VVAIADELKVARRQGRRVGSVAATTADILLATTVIGSMLAIGTVYAVLLIPVAGIVVVALAVGLRSTGATPLRVATPALIAFALAAYTLLQATPLPIRLLAAIAPANADVWRRSLLPFGSSGPSWATLSLDPGASIVEVLKWQVYGWVFVLSAWMSARRGAQWGITLVFGCAVLLSLVTLGHGLADATSIFGLYKPQASIGPWHMSPLLNPNNLAGYLNLGAMCGLGLLVARKPFVSRWTIALGVATIVGIDVISASRAGVLVLPVGVALFAFLQRVPDEGRTESVSRRAFPWLLGAAVGGGFILAGLGGTATTWQELFDKNLEKLAMVSWTRPMVGEHFWFGIGRGAFESVFPSYRSYQGNIVFTHAENFPAQWVSEWGVPVACLAMMGWAWLFRPTHMGLQRSSIHAGGWVGVLIVLLQNLLDLALELPAVVIAVAAVLGSLWGDVRRRGVTTGEAWPSKAQANTIQSKAFIAAGAFAVSATAVLTGFVGTHDVAGEKSDLYLELGRTSTKDPAAVAHFRDELRTAMRRHPAEPYFPLLGAIAAQTARDSNPMPWIQRSLERATVNGSAHLLLAQVLGATRAKYQALMELRFAAHDDRNLVGAAAGSAVSLTHDFEELMRAVPQGPLGGYLMEAMSSQLPNAGDADLRERLQREALARDDNRMWSHRALAERLVERIRAKDSRACGGSTLETCEAELVRHVAALERAFPERSDADVIRANLLVAKGQPDEGEQLLARRCGSVEDRPACLKARLSLAALVGDSRVLASAAKDALTSGCLSPNECADLASSIGDLMGARGDWGGAAAYYTRAAHEDPEESYWLKLAAAAGRLGSHAEAVEALEKVRQIRGRPDPDLDRQIETERAKALGLFAR